MLAHVRTLTESVLQTRAVESGLSSPEPRSCVSTVCIISYNLCAVKGTLVNNFFSLAFQLLHIACGGNKKHTVLSLGVSVDWNRTADSMLQDTF